MVLLQTVTGNWKTMKLGLMLATALLVCVPSYGAYSSCLTTTALSTFGNTTTGDPTTGCQFVDATFSTFQVPQAASGAHTLPDPYIVPDVNNFPATITLAANTVATPTAAQIFVVESPTNPGRVQFSSPGPGKAKDVDTNFCTASGGSQGWCIQGANQTLVSSITYVGNFTNPISIIGLSGAAISHSSGGAGATAVVFREFCTGQAVFDHTGATCTQYGILQGGTINGNFNTLPFLASVLLNTPTSGVISFRDTIYLQTDNGTGSFAAVNPFDLFTTPEPSTFLLFSGLLAGLGFAKFRRKRA